MRGDFVFVESRYDYWGKRPMLAKLYAPGTTNELLPHLEGARILRVRLGLLVAGTEVLARGSKSKGERYRQTWVCTVNRVPPEEWPSPPRGNTGFDVADDDRDF
jgi:hypothetical protein